MDYILQISGNIKDLGRLWTKWVENWIVKDYQQYQISQSWLLKLQVRIVKE